MGYTAEQGRTDPQSPYPQPPVTSIEQRLADLEGRLVRLEASVPRADRVTLLVFSGELGKVLAGLMIAATAASPGMHVTVFFTFRDLHVLKERRTCAGKAIKERMIDLMTPTGPGSMNVSRLNLLGAGRIMLKMMMKEKDVVSATALLDIARESGVRLVACSMTMQVMGIREEEPTPGIEVAGAASYLVDASRSGCTLFI